MDWDAYTVFSVISGAVLVLVGLAATSLRARDRAWGVIGGLALGGYGIFVAAQTSGTYYFSPVVFVIPFALVGYLIVAAAHGRGRRPAAERAPEILRTSGEEPERPPAPVEPAAPRTGSAGRPASIDASAPCSPTGVALWPAHSGSDDYSPREIQAIAVPGKVRVPRTTVTGQHGSDDQFGAAVPSPVREGGRAGDAAHDATASARPRRSGPAESEPAVIEMVWGSCTDVGRVRKVNEDSLLGVPPVFLVADGMGGYAAGDVASATVVEEFAGAAGEESVTPEWVLGCFRRADARIRDGVEGGTTVSGAAIVRQDGQPYWLVFNVGDSRVYHCADGAVNQVTVDHSVVQEMVDAGEIPAERARFHPQRHIITRAIGSPEELAPDFWLLPIARGERLMMCSDGLTSEVGDGRIGELLTQAADPQRTAESLVAAACAAGGRDNVSAVVVDVISVGSDDDEVPLDSRTRPRVTSVDHSDPESTVPRPRAAELVPRPGA